MTASTDNALPIELESLQALSNIARFFPSCCSKAMCIWRSRGTSATGDIVLYKYCHAQNNSLADYARQIIHGYMRQLQGAIMASLLTQLTAFSLL